MACDAPSGNPALEGSAAMRAIAIPDALSRRRCDGIGRLPARSLRRFDRAHQIRRTKRLLQTDDVGELRRFGQKVQRGHSGNRNDGQARHAGAQRCNQIGAVGALQKDIDDRKIEACLPRTASMRTRRFPPRRFRNGGCAARWKSSYGRRPDRQQQARGASKPPGSVVQQPTMKIRDFGGSAGIIQPVGKEAVTCHVEFLSGIVR